MTFGRDVFTTTSSMASSEMRDMGSDILELTGCGLDAGFQRWKGNVLSSGETMILVIGEISDAYAASPEEEQRPARGINPTAH